MKQFYRNSKSDDVNWFSRKRYYVTFLVFCGMVISVLLRSNLSIAVVDMTSHKNISKGNITYTKEAEFKWTSIEKGFILSSFSWGYFFGPFGGILTSRFSGVTVFGAGLLITSILTILSPIFVRQNMIVFIIGRIFEGIAESFSVSSSSEIFVYWAPPNERTRLISTAYSGFFFGAGIAYPLCGFTVQNYGWETIFFITGGISLLWYLIWLLFVGNYPATDRFISEKEKRYLSLKVDHPSNKKIIYPWKSIFLSKAVWAFLNERFVGAWLISFVIYCLPLYIKDVHDLTIENIGLISAIPNFCSFFAQGVASFIADYLRNHQILTISNVHKLFFILAKILSIIILVLMITCMDFTGTIICLSLFRICYSFADAASCVLPLDMAPQYASFLVGLGSIALSLGYILNPILMGVIVSNHTKNEWNKYFIFLCAWNVWGGVIFWLFGSGQIQPWAKQIIYKTNQQQEKYEKEMEVKCSN